MKARTEPSLIPTELHRLADTVESFLSFAERQDSRLRRAERECDELRAKLREAEDKACAFRCLVAEVRYSLIMCDFEHLATFETWAHEWLKRTEDIEPREPDF